MSCFLALWSLATCNHSSTSSTWSLLTCSCWTTSSSRQLVNCKSPIYSSTVILQGWSFLPCKRGSVWFPERPQATFWDFLKNFWAAPRTNPTPFLEYKKLQESAMACLPTVLTFRGDMQGASATRLTPPVHNLNHYRILRLNIGDTISNMNMEDVRKFFVTKDITSLTDVAYIPHTTGKHSTVVIEWGSTTLSNDLDISDRVAQACYFPSQKTVTTGWQTLQLHVLFSRSLSAHVGQQEIQM